MRLALLLLLLLLRFAAAAAAAAVVPLICLTLTAVIMTSPGQPQHARSLQYTKGTTGARSPATAYPMPVPLLTAPP
jgi:hypothetical protein